MVIKADSSCQSLTITPCFYKNFQYTKHISTSVSHWINCCSQLPVNWNHVDVKMTSKQLPHTFNIFSFFFFFNIPKCSIVPFSVPLVRYIQWWKQRGIYFVMYPAKFGHLLIHLLHRSTRRLFHRFAVTHFFVKI